MWAIKTCCFVLDHNPMHVSAFKFILTLAKETDGIMGDEGEERRGGKRGEGRKGRHAIREWERKGKGRSI